MADAKKLMPFILKWEGGFVNDPVDRGGATNKGVTIGTFRQFYGANATVEQLKNITDEQWLTIFKSGYWTPWKADSINCQAIANIVVDWAWASGTVTSIKQVQTLLKTHYDSTIVVDGKVGVHTLRVINEANPEVLFIRIKAARIEFVDAIVRRNPSQVKFINGWKNRINAISFGC